MTFKTNVLLAVCLVCFGTSACDGGSTSPPAGGGGSGLTAGAPGQGGGSAANAGASGAALAGAAAMGQAGSGGVASGAGAGGSVTVLSPIDTVKDMKLGWNLGNTLDATPGGETGWGNPMTTKAMIDAVKAAGFNTVRLPVTWQDHLGAAPDYAIDSAWLDRVEEVTNYVLSNGMYAIVNTHHDEWVSLMPDADQTVIKDKFGKLWTQIATRFRNYDYHLVFETLNEPRTKDATEWTGGTPAARALLNADNALAVKAIRDTGGNNAQRLIMIPTHGANSSTECINDLVVPNNDPRIILSLHTYYPWAFSGDAKGTADFGSASDISAMNSELDRIVSLTIAKGRAAIIGEWGSLDKGNTAARVAHAHAYAAAVRKHGLLPVWWDNNVIGAEAGFGLLNRSALTWYFPEIKDALAASATSAP
jgi:endoglucanase